MRAKKIHFVSICLAVIGLLLLPSALWATDAKPAQWKAQHEWNPGDSTRSNGWEPTFKKILDNAKGKLTIDFFEPGSLVPVSDMFRAVQKGAIDVYLGSASRNTEIPQGLGLVSQGLPFAWSTPEDAYKILWEKGLMKLLQDMYAKEFGLMYFPAGGSGQYGLSTTFPFTGLADLKNKKIRAFPTYAPLLEALGAVPTAVAGAELYMALKLGTIDGMIYSFNGFVTQKFGEVVKYCMFPPMITPPLGVTFINMESWKKLPKDVQDNIAKTIQGEFLPSTHKAMEQDTRSIKNSGVKPVKLSDEDVKKLRAMAIKSWESIAAKGPLADQAIKIIRDYYGM